MPRQGTLRAARRCDAGGDSEDLAAVMTRSIYEGAAQMLLQEVLHYRAESLRCMQ